MNLGDVIKVEEGTSITIDGEEYKTNSNDVIAYKSPIIDFNIGSQLIVHESQEAIFFADGKMLDSFGSGRHTLDTDNIPLIKDYFKAIIGKSDDSKGEKASPFHCEVYFVNKVHLLNLKWGTSGQVNVTDPVLNFNYNAGANGEFGIQITDARKFLNKLIGTMSLFTKQNVEEYFRGLIGTRVKVLLTTILNKESFTKVNEKLNDMSNEMKEALGKELEEYGISFVNFFVMGIKADENYEKIQAKVLEGASIDIETSAEARRIKTLAEADRARLDTLGTDYMGEQTAKAMNAYAANEGAAGNVGGMVGQIPVAMAMGEMIKDRLANNIQTTSNNQTTQEPTNNVSNGKAKFCAYCGKELQPEFKICPYCGEAR